MKTRITNADELKQEIARLSKLRREQEFYLQDQYTLLKGKVEAPVRFINNFSSQIPGVGIVKGIFSGITSANSSSSAAEGKSDWMTKALRVGLPFILNRTLLRNAGWLKKALVLLASEGAVGQINQNNVSSLFSKVTDFIRPKKSKKKHKKVEPLEKEQDTYNFGIPPDSETY